MDQRSNPAERVVAVALLTQRELDLLGPAFRWAWPVDEAPSFDELIRAIDEADEALLQCDQTRAG